MCSTSSITTMFSTTRETVCSAVKLNDGVEMPVLGLGLLTAGADSVNKALTAGYRLFDTGPMYKYVTKLTICIIN